jgi:ankyrin repeat protein
MAEKIPLELVAIICEKIEIFLLIEISHNNTKNPYNNCMYILNKKSIEKFKIKNTWKKLNTVNLIKSNDLLGIKYLVSKNIDISDDYWAIVYAIRDGYFEMVKYLEKIGADIMGYEKLRYALENGHLEIVKYLIENNKPKFNKFYLDSAFICASGHGHLDILKYLVNLGVNVKTENVKLDRNSAVIWACQCGYLDIVKYLVSLGADPFDRKNHGFIMACQCGHLEIVKYLVSLGADFTVQNHKGIRQASRYGRLSVVEYLVSIGSNPFAKNYKGICGALYNNKYSTVEYLASLGIDKNAIILQNRGYQKYLRENKKI